MLHSHGDLGAGGKISASTVFDTIIHITLLKYFKSLVTCDSLFKQTPKKEDPSICFRSATLENFTPEHRSAVVSDFECHSPFALLHNKLNCNNNSRVSPKKQIMIIIMIVIIIYFYRLIIIMWIGLYGIHTSSLS